MKKSFLLTPAFILLGIAAALAGDQPRTGGALIFGRGADAIHLDPARCDDVESIKVTENIFEGLVRYRQGSMEVEPSLATSWQTSTDGTQWTFQLRRDVTFHDGSPFDADAVLFSFMRQIDAKHPYYRKDFSYAEFTFQYVKKIEPVDRYTVRFILEKPYAPFLQNLAMAAANIVSPSAVKKWGEDFRLYPVGTGPFKFVEWIPKDRIVLERNPGYWDGPAYLEKLIFKSTVDNEDRLLELKTGAIHAMTGISPDNLSEIKKHEDLVLDTKPGLNVGYLAMNTEKKPFDQVKVRQAVNHAINKQNLVKILYRDLAIPAKNPLPPTLWGYADEVEDYAYDVQTARGLLKEAGYEQGFETTLWTMPVPRPYMPQPEETARIIKASLAAVGIRVKLVSTDWDAYLDKVSNGEHDMCLLGWVADTGDPDNFLYVLLDRDNAHKPKAQNVAFWKNEEVHDLLIGAQQITDQNQRAELYRHAQKIIHQEAPWVPLAHAEQMVAFHKSVHGIQQHPTGMINFHKVWKD